MKQLAFALLFSLVGFAGCGDEADKASVAITAACDDLCGTQVAQSTDCPPAAKTNCVNFCKAVFGNFNDSCANAIKAVAQCYRDNPVQYECSGGDLPMGEIPAACEAAIQAQGANCK